VPAEDHVDAADRLGEFDVLPETEVRQREHQIGPGLKIGDHLPGLHGEIAIDFDLLAGARDGVQIRSDKPEYADAVAAHILDYIASDLAR